MSNTIDPVREWAFYLAAGEFAPGATVGAAMRYVAYVGSAGSPGHDARTQVVTALPAGSPVIWDDALSFLEAA